MNYRYLNEPTFSVCVTSSFNWYDRVVNKILKKAPVIHWNRFVQDFHLKFSKPYSQGLGCLESPNVYVLLDSTKINDISNKRCLRKIYNMRVNTGAIMLC